MANTIKVKRSNTASVTPSLVFGELGWNSADSKLFVGSFSDTSVQLGSVTTLSIVTANGVSGSVANATTTPAITVTLGAITPSSVSTGVVTHSAGTALLPSITTTGDTNTGIWFPAADTIAISTGGVERCRINSAGTITGTTIQAYSASLTGLAGITQQYQGFVASDGSDGWFCYSPAQTRTALALTVGTDVQAYKAGLQSLGNISTTGADRVIYATATNVYTTSAFTTFGRSLVDDSDAATARTTLGIGISANALCGGRITLQSGVPCSITDQSAKNLLYWTPYLHNSVGLFDVASSTWAAYTFSEMSYSIAAFGVSTNYDLFIYLVGGVLTLVHSPWSTSTARANAISLQDGVYVLTSDKTRRYLGTFRVISTAGSPVTDDALSSRLVWNYYNRVPRQIKCYLVASHTYSTATWREYNASTVVGDTRMQFVSGLAESAISLTVSNTLQYCYIAMAMDSTTVASSPNLHQGASTSSIGCSLSFTYAPQIGFHYLQVIESGISASSAAQSLYSEGIVFC